MMNEKMKWSTISGENVKLFIALSQITVLSEDNPQIRPSPRWPSTLKYIYIYKICKV
jgi:hypothetical protein